MKKFKFCLVILLVFTALFANSQIRKSLADSIVLDMIGNDNTIVYSMTESIGREDIIVTADGIELTNPYNSSYVYFIDDIPEANWAHPCRYCFVNTSNGELNIENQRFCPSNYESFIRIGITPSHNNTRSWPYDSYTIPQKASPNGKLYAVLIGGDPINHPSIKIWFNLSCVYTALVNRYGFMEYDGFKRHIIAIAPYEVTDLSLDLNHSNGFFDKYDLPDPGELEYSKNNIIDIFRNLAGTSNTIDQIPELNENDQLFVFLCGHGDNVYGQSYFNIDHSNSVFLYDYELANCVRDIKCSQMTFMIDCCYSGGFIDDLMNDSNAACKNRAVHTCTDANHYGWVEEHITKRNRDYETWQRVDEFVYYWSAALLGYYPILEEQADSLLGPWYQFDSTAIGQFPWNQIASFHEGDGYSHTGYDVSPDTNQDGIVSMDEAFIFADNLDSYSHNGYFNPIRMLDYFNDSCVEYPKSSYESTFTKELITLDGYKGTIDNDAETGIGHNYLLDNNILISEGTSLKIMNEFAVNGNNNIIINRGMLATDINLNNARFNNTKLVNIGGDLALRQCVFDTCETIRTQDGPFTIVQSVFNQTCIVACTDTPPLESYCITLNGNTFNNTISNASIYLQDIPRCNITLNTIRSGGDGISVKGLNNTCQNYLFNSNIIWHCGGSGFVAYDSNGRLSGNSITSNSIDGLRSLNMSDLYMRGDSTISLLEDAPKILGNGRFQVYATNNSYPQDFHYNLLRGNRTDTDYILNYETSQSQNGNPVTFDVSKNCWYPIADNDIISHLFISGNGLFNYLPTWTPSGITVTPPVGPIDRLNMGNYLAGNGDFDEAKEVFMQLVTDYPNTTEAISSLKALYSVELESGGNFLDLKDYYLSLIPNNYLSKVADNLANKCDIQLGNYTDAITWYENKINNQNTSYSERIFAEIDLGDLYLKINDSSYRGIKGRFVQYIPTSKEAHAQRTKYLLSLLPEYTGNNPMPKSFETTSENTYDMQFICYPNPVNNVLSLSYMLENITNVEISIINTLGVEVEYINKDMQHTSNHIIDIDMSNKPAGIYLCRISTDCGYMKTMKIIVQH